jgi:RNA polymerase sigma factor (sigma-70 family)
VATSQISKVIDYLRGTVLAGGEADLTDGQLLECFVRHRDEAAAAALVRRHGPMVWGVCRRVLHSHQDAEDAFQATFLVLLRKAASITSRELVANWLYGVAHQTALKARATTAKRMGREKQVIEMPEPEARTEPDLWPDLQPLLDQELSRLPDKYRLAIVLCDLECKTRKEAAQKLKIPEGTLSSRLTTARTMLAKRLARHGLAVSGVSVAAVLAQNLASASVPTSVLSSTIKAVTLVATGNTAATGLITAKVAALTEGVVKTMLLTKLKTVTMLKLVLSLVTLTSVMVLAWGQTGPASTGDKGNSVEKPAAKDEKQAAPAQPKGPPRDFTNSIGMKFVWIPPGSFLMGSPKEEEDRGGNEIQHKVTLTKGFYIGVYSVTQEQWQEVMGNNPSRFKGEKNLPVETISWNDCQEFLKKLREKDKKAYRLPTEAEWEFCCRAGTKTPFHFGNTISTDQSNYHGDYTYGDGKKGVYRQRTTPVGSFPANAWGLHDMHGNVFSWCQDWLGDYPKKDVVDPQGPNKPQYGELRVVRGGSWQAPPCRSACRGGDGPTLRRPGLMGLRVCFCLD